MRGHRGFTITEVLVAVTIVGVLSAAAVTNYFAAVGRTRWDASRQVLLKMYDGEWKFFGTPPPDGNGGLSFASLPTTPCTGPPGLVAFCQAVWRTLLGMDNPNLVGATVAYSVAAVAGTPPTFSVTASYDPDGAGPAIAVTQTIDQDRTLCPACPTCLPVGCSWGRP